VYSVTWGKGKPDTAQGGLESLGWVASTGGDGRINVWAFEVSLWCRAVSVAGFDPFKSQEPPDSTQRSPPKYKLIARLEDAHGVNDVNSIAWCPREGYEDLIATVGDDGIAKIWKVVSV
jgi:WD40 repeat protein